MMFVRSFFNRLNLIFFIRFLMAQSERTFIRLYSITYGKSESISITIAQKITHSFLHYRQLRIRSFFNHPKPFFFRFFSSWFHYTVPIKRAFTPYLSELKNAWIFYICDIIVANDRDTMKWNGKKTEQIKLETIQLTKITNKTASWWNTQYENAYQCWNV